MAQWLRPVPPLPENLASVPSTYGWQLSNACMSRSRGSTALCWPLHASALPVHTPHRNAHK